MPINPLPEAGLMNFINPNPQHYSNPLKFPLQTSRSDVDKICRSVFAGQNRRRYGGFKRNDENSCSKWKEQIRIRFSITNLSTKKLPVIEEFIENLETISWEDILEQSGLSREQITEAREMYRRSKPRHNLLGNGRNAAQRSRRDDSGHCQSAFSARKYRQTRRGTCVPCADIPTCRATARWAFGTKLKPEFARKTRKRI